ncbi:MAG: hypothetical protein WCH65_04550 [bacterium]
MEDIKIIVGQNQQEQFEFANKLLAGFDEKTLKIINTVEIPSAKSSAAIISCNAYFKERLSVVYLPLEGIISITYSEGEINAFYRNKIFKISFTKKDKKDTIKLMHI